MDLSKEDKKILRLEQKRRDLFSQYNPLPNNSERYKLWKKDKLAANKLNSLIYDRTGNFREDKKHLLIGNSLNINLLRRRK